MSEPDDFQELGHEWPPRQRNGENGDDGDSTPPDDDNGDSGRPDDNGSVFKEIAPDLDDD